MANNLAGPQGYVRARKEATTDGNHGSSFMRTVERRPYFPLLRVVPTDEASVLEVAKRVVATNKNSTGAAPAAAAGGRRPTSDHGEGKVTVVTGGLTNALFKVDLPAAGAAPASVLVRLFGAEGLIDRDDESATLARLCDGAGTVHAGLDYLGRFGNGRVETFLPDRRPADARDFGREGFALEVARQLARLHHGFEERGAEGRQREPSLWGVTELWIEELGHKLQEKCGEDASLMQLFSQATNGVLVSPTTLGDAATSANTRDVTAAQIKATLSNELTWLKTTLEARFPHAAVAFCHNDANAGNILLHAGVDVHDDGSYDCQSVCLIDWEYGARNYAMFDVANFFCEHCGGLDNARPDPARFPPPDRRRRFLEEYVRARDGGDAAGRGGAGVADLCAQADLFELASHLFWGVWGVLQAATEVADGKFAREDAAARLEGRTGRDTWDNLRYGKNRLERYRGRREGMAGVHR